MACFRPMTAWYSKHINPSGRRSLVFSPASALEPDSPLDIACGQCVGCRLERSRQWAIRCIHEASLYDDNCFITLTFSPDEIVKRSNPFTVDVRDFQLFMKRLRKRFGSNIRFFHCGEYGEEFGRPHYHACLFNFDFPDKTLFRVTNGHRLYVSESLSQLWPFGFHTIGTLTFESAAYVSRYIMKKVTGDMSQDHYSIIDPDNGEYLGQRKPEYVTMSRRPGIGKGWFDKYQKEVYPDDFVIVNGHKCRPPKYYDRLLETTRPYELDLVKDNRFMSARDFADNNTPDRLKVRETILKDRLSRLVRPLENIDD